MIKKLGVVLIGLLVLVLAGCVRFQANLDVSPENTVSGDIVVAVIVGDENDSKQHAIAAADDIEAQLLSGISGAQGVTRTDYDQDGYAGYRFTFDKTPLDAFSGAGSEGALTLTRTGDEFTFTGSLDFTPDDDEVIAEDDDTSDIAVEITFPGDITDTNGEVSGTTVRWETTYQARIDMTATGSAIPSGPPAWVLPVVAAAGIVIVAVLLAYVIRRRRVS